MKNIKLNKDECFDNPLKMNVGLSQSNYWKYENQTSGGLKSELPGVWKSNGSKTEKINKTDNSETDLIYPAELQEEEQYRRYFKEALELEILEQGYPADKAVLYEILELLVETVTSRKKFLRICGEEKPKEVVKSRLMKLDSSHIQYILECLKENSTQMLNEFVEKILVHERDRKGSIQTTQEVEIYFNFVGRFVPPKFAEVELTPEELEEIRKREERKDRLHQNYLKRKASGWQRQYEDRTKAKKKAEMDAKKNALRAEDIAKGVFIPVSNMPKLEPKIAPQKGA